MNVLRKSNTHKNGLIRSIKVACAIVTLITTIAASAAAKLTPTADKDWNFLVIVVDDLGFMDIEPNNPNSFYQTPSLNKFAEQSINFSNSYAANPVCSPSRAALMTGINPARLHTTDWFHHKESKRRKGSFKAADSIDHLPMSAQTMAEVLPERYKSTFIGKWHLGEEEQYWPENRGFDLNIGGWGAGSPAGGYFAPYKNPRLNQGPEGEYLTERLTNEAIAQLNQQKDDPFLMVLSYYSVHVPMQAPEKTINKYKALAEDLTPDEEFSTEHQVWPYSKQARKVRVKQNNAIYAAMVEEMDRNIGRVLAQLEQSGLADNTIVFFTSDNGGLSTSEGHPTSNLPLRGGKGWAYEGGIKVPLLVKIPGMHEGGKVNKTPVVGMDIPATIFDLSQAKTKAIDGQSLAPLIINSLEQQSRPLFWHYPHYSNQGGMPAAAVRLGKYKLIQNLENGTVTLFDLSEDLGEKKDLSAIKPEVTKALTEKLATWYNEVDAQFLRAKNKSQPWSTQAH